MADGDFLTGLSLRARPANAMAEAAVLGALLANNRAREQCLSLSPADFSTPDYARLYARIIGDIDLGRRVDAVSLRGHFDPEMLADVTASMLGLAIQHFVVEIKDCAARRALIDIAEALATEAFVGGATLESMINAAARIDAITAGASSGSGTDLGGAVMGALEMLDRAQKKQSPEGVLTGFRSIDRRLGGLENETMTVLAARPGMGKTGLGCNIAMNAASTGIPVIMFSLEMSRTQLARRVLASATGVPVIAIKRGSVNLDDTGRLVAAGQQMRDLPLWIEDASGVGHSTISARVRAWRRKNPGYCLAIVDHLHIVKPDDADVRNGATYAVGQVSVALKRLSKACNLPVVALAQLSRKPEEREDKRPNLGDLRQAGDIEQDADSVGFLYRDEYYANQAPDPKQKDGESDEKFANRKSLLERRKQEAKGKAELIWAKVRDGEPGTDELNFEAVTASFSEVV